MNRAVYKYDIVKWLVFSIFLILIASSQYPNSVLVIKRSILLCMCFVILMSILHCASNFFYRLLGLIEMYAWFHISLSPMHRGSELRYSDNRFSRNSVLAYVVYRSALCRILTKVRHRSNLITSHYSVI